MRPVAMALPSQKLVWFYRSYFEPMHLLPFVVSEVDYAREYRVNQIQSFEDQNETLHEHRSTPHSNHGLCLAVAACLIAGCNSVKPEGGAGKRHKVAFVT